MRSKECWSENTNGKVQRRKPLTGKQTSKALFGCQFNLSFLFRSWDKVCVVLKGSKMLFYKDQKSYRSSPDNLYRGEPPMELIGGQAEVASDYTKKKHVFRLK